MKTAAPAGELTVAIAGNPNSGKSTLFNRLTGMRQKVANYAGVTVERKEGVARVGDRNIRFVDLPGTYALTPQSEEQRIASAVILGHHPESPAPDGILVVIDSTALEKSLYLVLQVIDTGVPTALVLNMTDELAMRGAEIDALHLSRQLDVPVIPISATRGTGLEELSSFLKTWHPQRHATEIPLPKIPLPTIVEVTERRQEAKKIARAVIRRHLEPHPWSDRLDHWVMHPVWGPLIFALVVLIVFQSIFSWAQPLMNGIDQLMNGAASFVRARISTPIVASFMADGVVAGVGSVVVFLPQILIVFMFLTFLEQSGYLARAALIMDRVMSKVGLQGKSFLPLISSYACAVPGIMATRTIESKRDRLATMFIAPFMTCSARLPVYAMLIGAFVPDRPILGRFFGLRAATLLGLYVVGFLAAFITASLLRSSVLQSDRRPFVMEIPPYRLPRWQSIALVLWDRAMIFLKRAGTVILGVSILMWFLVSFPRSSGAPTVEASLAGQFGHVIEPVIHPLGFNWKIGIGLLSAQAAREVMVATMGTIYRVSTETDTQSLQSALHNDLTPLAAVSLMIFFALAMQCTSTLAVAKRESNSWAMPLAMFLYMNGVAYMASFLVFQGGRLLGWN